MQLSIELKSILAYYDGPDVIEAIDPFGNQYLGMALEPQRKSFRFLLVSLSPRQFTQFCRGTVDLQSILKETPPFGWYDCETDNLEEPIQLNSRIEDPIPDHLMPASDYFLVNHHQNQNAAMDEAAARQNFVVHLKAEPKNQSRAHKLKLKDYGELILSLNSLVVSAIPKQTSDGESLDRSKVDLDIVVPAAEGSLEIVLEATHSDEDLFDPHLMLVSSFKQIDKAISLATDVDRVKALSEKFGVEFTKKFLKLFQILLRSEIDLNYSWAEPRFRSGQATTVAYSKTQDLVDSIRKKGDDILHEGSRTVTGRLERFNRRLGNWGLSTETGVIVGTIDREDRPEKLDGLLVDGLYTFECDFEQTFAQAWKEEEPTLILRSIKPAH